MLKSNSLARTVGSARLLSIRVAQDLTHGNDLINLKKFFAHKFIICGRIFFPFHSKEGKLYTVQTSENHDRIGRAPGDRQRFSFAQFIEHFNSLDLNHAQVGITRRLNYLKLKAAIYQPTSKWATRFALALSTSVPAAIFAPDNVHYIPDICNYPINSTFP